MGSLKIENLNQFVDALHACSVGIFEFYAVAQAAQAAQVSLQNIDHLLRWDTEKYARITIERTDDFELVLLCWGPGQHSDIHDHNGERGWMKVIQGELEEDLFGSKDGGEAMSLVKHRVMTIDQAYDVNDSLGFHRIINRSSERSISLHLYVTPVDVYHVYDEEKEIKIKKKMSLTLT